MMLWLPVFNIQKEKQRRRTNKLSKGTWLSHFSFFSLPFIFFQIGTRNQKSKAKNYFCFINIDVGQEYVSPVKKNSINNIPTPKKNSINSNPTPTSNNSSHLRDAHCVSGAVLTASYILTHFVFTKICSFICKID